MRIMPLIMPSMMPTFPVLASRPSKAHIEEMYY